MRDIKFRAWDAELNKFYEPTYEAYKGYLFELLIGMGGRLCSHTMTGITDESMFPDRFKLQQFTGLRDRNGREIYEGDVVRVWHDRGYDDGFYTVGVVEYSPAEFYIRGDGYSITCHFHYNDSEREIIGNIYENPELING